MDGTSTAVSASASIATPAPAPVGGAPAPSSGDSFLSLVPAEYKSEAWVQDYAKATDPVGEMFKGHANARSLIGKKSTGLEVPTDDAAPEAWKAFHKALGVPDNVEGYQHAPIDYSQESEQVQNYLKEASKDDSFLKGMKEVALQAGITPKQFQSLATAFDTANLARVKSSIEASTNEAQQKSEATLKQFGELYGAEADNVKRIGSEIANKVLPENIRATKNPELMLFESLRFIHEKLYKSDTVSSGTQSSPMETADSVQSEIMRLRATPEYTNMMDKGHPAMRQKVDALYARKVELQRAGRKDG